MKILALVALMFLGGGMHATAPASAAPTAAAATSVSVDDAKNDTKNLNPDSKPSKAVRRDADIRSVTFSVSDTAFTTVVKAAALADTSKANSVLSMRIYQWDEFGDSHSMPVSFVVGGVGAGFDQHTLDVCPEASGKASKKTDTVKVVLPLSCLLAESLTVEVQRVTWDVEGKGMVVSDKSSLKDKLPLD